MSRRWRRSLPAPFRPVGLLFVAATAVAAGAGEAAGAEAAVRIARPGAAGASGDTVPEARVDEIFRRWDDADSPGCAVAVMRDGEEVFARGYGTADLEDGTPITPETRFYAASVSKQFTAATVALAARRGELSLDDPVRKHLPELAASADTIRVRDLIHHVSGLRDMYSLLRLAGRPVEEVTPEEVVQLLARQQGLNFPPRTEYRYSNSGYLLLGVILERATGTGLAEYADRHLFRPAGMAHTHFHHDDLHRIPRRAIGYRRDADGEGFERDYLAGFTGIGPGGMWTTVGDLLRWSRELGRDGVGGDAFGDLLATRGVLRGGDTLDYAFGLRVGSYKGLATVGHGGSFMGYRTHLLRFPDHGFAVSCLCNLAGTDPGRLVRRVADAYLEAELREALSTYVGRYRSEELDVTYALHLDAADLILKGPDGEERTLRPAGRDTFEAGATEYRFVRDGQRRVTGFTVHTGRAEGMRFSRISSRGRGRGRPLPRP